MTGEQRGELTWRKSSASNAQNGCVEVATPRWAAYVRDSKDRAAGLLKFPPDAWTALLGGIRRGEFDSPE